MKRFILVLLLTISGQLQAGVFGRSKEDQQRIQQFEQQLAQQRQSTGAWQLISGVCAVGAITLLFIGTALGSRIRRHEKKIKPKPEERVNRLTALLRQHWQPKPIKKPKVDPALKKLTGAQRAAETMRHSVLSFEFWVSPLGRLREWVRLNSTISAILLVPAVLVFPLVGWIIYQVAGWFSMLVGLATSLIVFPILALLAIAAMAFAITILRAITGK